MKITILGSGSAYGVPACFNNWGNVQNRQDPHNQRSRFSFLLEDCGKSILIDIGPEFRLQVNKNSVSDIDAVYLTHAHYDHIAGLPELIRASALLGHPITIYASAETLAELRKSYAFMFNSYKEVGKDGLIWREIKAGKNIIEGMDWTCFELPHNHIHSWGFRYKDFAVVTDYDTISDEILNNLRGLRLLLLECNNGMEQLKNGHSNWPQIKLWLEELRPQKTLLTHISAKVNEAELKALLPPNVELAYDGLSSAI